MKWTLFFVFSFSLFIGFRTKCQAQHITTPIHYSKWIQNYSNSEKLSLNNSLAELYHSSNIEENDTFDLFLGERTNFSEIPIAFFMDSANGKVIQYEKLEIGINLPMDAQKLIGNFVKTGRGINPFDPEQIKITAKFYHIDNLPSSYSGVIPFGHIISSDCFKKIDAFYYEEFHHEMQDDRFKQGYWKKDTTSFNFRIRYAPQKTGWWACSINIYVQNELKYILPTFNFLCLTGTSNGFISGISENKRLLQFENGKNFFGIGQNIPVADMPNAIIPKGLGPAREQPPKGFDLQREYISDLASNGGNLVRIMHSEWADAIEWEKLNDYSMNMNFAWETDRTFELCEEKDVFLLWTLQYHAPLMYHNPYGNDALSWPSSPYQKELKLEKPEDFFTNEEAIKFYQYKLRYQFSRWGYSKMIAGVLLINEMNEMAANPFVEPAHHPYFHDTVFRNQVGKWFTRMKNYIQDDLDYPFMIGSSFTGDVGEHVGDDPIMSAADFNDYHPYGENRNRNLAARFGGMNFIPGYGIFLRYKKPLIIGEMGTWATEFLHQCHENEFHTDLWATAFMGGWAGGLHWHNWEDNYQKDLRKNFKALHLFLQDVNFDFYNWEPSRWPETKMNEPDYSEKRNDYYENLYLTANSGANKADRAIGWVHNRSHYWYNLPETECEKNASNKNSKQSIGKEAYKPGDDDTGKFEKYEGKENEDKRITRLSGMQNFKKFTIEWYHTKTGELLATTKEYHGIGDFKIKIPDIINQQEYQDLGYKIYTGKCFTKNCYNANF